MTRRGARTAAADGIGCGLATPWHRISPRSCHETGWADQDRYLHPITLTTLEHEIQATCPPEAVWAVLANLDSVQEYNPGVRRAEILGSERAGVGARRSCDLHPNGRVIERVTHWEEGRALGLEVLESDWPIHFMRWVTRLEPKDEGTLITQSLEYQVKFGPLGWLLDRIVMKRKLAAALDDVFVSLVRFAERRATDNTASASANHPRAEVH